MLKHSLCLLLLFSGASFADEFWISICRVSQDHTPKKERTESTDYVLGYKVLEGDVLIGHDERTEDLRDYLDDLEDYQSVEVTQSSFQAAYGVIFGTPDQMHEEYYIVDAALQTIKSHTLKARIKLKPENPITPILKYYVNSL